MIEACKTSFLNTFLAMKEKPSNAIKVTTAWDNVIKIDNSSFNEIISKAYENTEVDLNFKTSENIIEVEYCRDSGCLPTYMCNNDIRGDRTTTGFFVKGTEPKDSCTIHKEVYIDIVDGKIADDYTPMWRKRLVSFLDYERKKKYNVKILDEDYFIISRIKNEN